MSNGDSPIRPADVIYVSDNNYVVPLAVSIRSLQANAVTPPVITVLCDDINAGNKRAVMKSVPEPETVQFVDLAGMELPDRTGKGISQRVSRAAFAVLLLEPKHVDSRRFVYLDADTVIRTDIGQLLDEPLDRSVLAATYDHAYTVFERRTERLAAAGAPNGRRFNSGVMVVSTNAWFAERIGERAQEISTHHDMMDQGALNVVCHGRWRELDPGWNVTTQALLRSRDFRGRPERVHIRHLTVVKPWISPNQHHDAARLMLQDFEEHFAKTVWGNTLHG